MSGLRAADAAPFVVTAVVGEPLPVDVDPDAVEERLARFYEALDLPRRPSTGDGEP